MAGQGNKTVTVYRVINICIILTLAYSILCMAVFLRTKRAVCSTTSSGVNLSIAFSLPTIITMGVRSYLMFQQRSKALQTISPATVSPRLAAACATCVQVLVFLWMILGCVNLLVALRAPTCLREPLEEWQNDLQGQNWRYGLSCRLHRALVALSVLMAIFIACLSFLDHHHPYRRGTGALNCYCSCVSRKAPKVPAPALSVSSSLSAWSVEKNDPHLFLVPESRQSRLEHEQWLQRRNSLSSQKAIYPHKYYYYDHRHRYQPYALSQSSRYSSTLRSVSEGRSLDLGDWNSSLCSSQSSTSGERGDLRRDAAMISAHGNTAVLPDVPPLPAVPAPTWSPALHHTPLSADPTIRALSTGSGLTLSLLHAKVAQDVLAAQAGNANTSSTVAGAPSAKREDADASPASTKNVQKITPKPISPRKTTPPPMPSVPPPPVPSHPPALRTVPAIPARAPGHHLTTLPTAPTQAIVAGSRPTTRSRSASTSATRSSRANLRRPSPIRYRHYHQQHHPHLQYHSHGGTGVSQTQLLPLQQYQHQRVWRRENSTNPSSVYSASSYGTERTTSIMTRGSTSTNSTTSALTGHVLAANRRPGGVVATAAMRQ
ncbi:hypothetical protein AYL99_05147 [Fonsecaea erecta]|uniref:Uncharacterized protein n=1 Tax=Fonsecaea erecta TaxID=1367422 RepID=A0A178ZMA0_9EURO|nr:hypothetical protein AYL99_05147 [Fonsecaea erecta]OAP60145.1 hypothetical protein AYL99_05147 [Fonsecaea erecta]